MNHLLPYRTMANYRSQRMCSYRAPLKTSAANLHYAFYRHITQNFLEIRKYACENFRQSADKIPSTSLRHRFLEVPYKHCC